MFLVMLLAAPLFMLRGPAADSKSVIAIVIFDVFMAAMIAHSVWCYRRLAPEATIGYGPPAAVVQAEAARGSRKFPLLALGIGALILVATWFYLQYEHKAHPVMLFLAPTLLLLGLGGTIHPPIFYAMRKDLPDPPEGARMIAYFLLIVGVGLGGFANWWVFWR